MELLNKMSGDKVQGPGKDIFFGLLKFGTTAACLSGVNTIVHKLIDKGYAATAEVSGDSLSAKVTITPPPKLQGVLTDVGAVPTQVTADWNAAVAADAIDHPINNGITAAN